MLFEGGKSAKQVQTWLGHHSPSDPTPARSR
jgi:hypothetical protein